MAKHATSGRRVHAAAGVMVAATLIIAGCSSGGAFSADGEWVEFGVDGEFSALFPDDPKREAMEPGGNLYVARSGRHEVGVVVAEVPDLPPESSLGLEALLAPGVEGFAASLSGTVVATEAVDAGGYPALDAEITGTKDGDDLVGFLRAAIVDDLLFQVISLGRDEDRDDVEAVFDRLVDGFEPEATT